MDLSPGGVIMGVIGGGVAFWYASLMSLGVVAKIFAFIATAAVCYFMSAAILNN